jgi:glucose-6-phosphate 1-epimerase
VHEIKSFANGFEYVEVSNSVAHAKIAFQGAHIFEYSSGGKDLLWLSESSKFELGTSIRGGIPICWPRFGNLDTSLPQHGFARVFLFDLINVDESSPNKTTLHFRLRDSEKSRAIWDYKFELEVIFINSDTLQVELKTTNTDDKAFMITQALHTYFKISNIANVHIKGLQNKPYLDTLTNEYKIQKDVSNAT